MALAVLTNGIGPGMARKPGMFESRVTGIERAWSIAVTENMKREPCRIAKGMLMGLDGQ